MVGQSVVDWLISWWVGRSIGWSVGCRWVIYNPFDGVMSCSCYNVHVIYYICKSLIVVCSAAMEELVCELRLFLDLLDREYLSAGVREKKMHLSNILHRVLSDKGEAVMSHVERVIKSYCYYRSNCNHLSSILTF